MKTVYKYPIPRNRANFSLILPDGFKFLRVSFQGDQLNLWAQVDNEVSTSEYKFGLYGTGHEIPNHAIYLTTYDDGPFVFHVYSL